MQFLDVIHGNICYCWFTNLSLWYIKDIVYTVEHVNGLEKSIILHFYSGSLKFLTYLHWWYEWIKTILLIKYFILDLSAFPWFYKHKWLWRGIDTKIDCHCMWWWRLGMKNGKMQINAPHCDMYNSLDSMQHFIFGIVWL